jgi:hypothetical protein
VKVARIHPADYGHDELRGFLWPQDRYVDLPAYIEDAVAGHFARCSELAKERCVAQITGRAASASISHWNLSTSPVATRSI